MALAIPTNRRVQATHDDGTVRVFESMTQATAQLHMHKKTITTYAGNGQPYKGYRFRLLAPGERPTPAPPAPAAPPPPVPVTDPLTFVFGPEAGELFAGKSVRATRDPQRISVFDIIQVATDSGADNPRQAWGRLCEQHPQAEVVTASHVWQFTGQGQRPTPVTDVAGVAELVQLLPGRSAASFRLKALGLLAQHLGATVAPPPSAAASDPFSFVFGPEAGDMFAGKTVRATRDPQRISVFDIIQVVCDDANPRVYWQRLREQHPTALIVTNSYKHLFPGQTRSTPVTDVKGMMELVMLLPGRKANAFRRSAAQLLIRYVGGDESLIAEVQAISELHQSGATQGTAVGLCRDAVETGQLTTAASQALPPPPHRLALMSPTMAGRSLWDFKGKKVCYLLTFPSPTDPQPLIKFGKTDDPERRIKEHLRELPSGTAVYCLHECAENTRAETEFRSWAQLNGYLTQDARPQTEVLKGVEPAVAEAKLVEVVRTAASPDQATALRMKELDLQLKQVEAAMQREATRQQLLGLIERMQTNPQLCTQLIDLYARTT